MWEKLSNSGELLKLLIPSNIRNNMCGWINYSGMVTSQKMTEREVDNRGSKSVSGLCGPVSHKTGTVKEQRVDGNWHKRDPFVFKVYSNGFREKLSSQNPFLVNNKHLVNTGHKTSAPLYLARKLKLVNTNMVANNNLNIIKGLNFSTTPQATKSDGWWIAGFVDAEGCFRISILKNKNFWGNPWDPSLYSENNGLGNTIPLSVRLYFQIGLHLKDENILKFIQSTLGVGKIYRSKTRTDSVELQVSSFKDMHAIINFFENYPLITQKWADYLLFKKAYELILNKQHLTMEGLKKLVEIKALINWGLPDLLKEAFPEIESVNNPRCEIIKEIPDPNWIAGFASGEGCFMVRIFKSASHVTGYQVQLKFQIAQHSRDRFLMERIVSYLDCGFISERGDILDFQVTRFSDITDNIIPFFKKYPIRGVKLNNFNDFCKGAILVSNKEHLTVQGLEKIKLLNSNMNTLRKSNED